MEALLFSAFLFATDMLAAYSFSTVISGIMTRTLITKRLLPLHFG